MVTGVSTLDEAEVVSALMDSATIVTTSGVLTLFLAAAAAAIGVGLFRFDDRLNCVDIALPDFCWPKHCSIDVKFT
jgi:hypothetical protein